MKDQLKEHVQFLTAHQGIKHAQVPNFMFLKGKLMLILNENPNLKDFKYEGISINNKIGIMVHGTDGHP